MSGKVKLGICNFCVPGTGVFAAKFVSEAGLDGMSLEFGSYGKGYPLSHRAIQEEYLREQQRYGIEFPNIGLSALDEIPLHAGKYTPYYQQVKELLQKAVKTASFMKIPQILVPSFGASEIRTKENFKNTVEILRYLCQLAEGILISSENSMNTQDQIRLIKEVDCRNFRLFYDSQNLFHNRSFNQAVMLEELYCYFGPQLHVKDGKKGILSGSLLGDGDSDFKGTMEVLKNHSYEGWIIMENLYENPLFRRHDNDVFQCFYEDTERLKAAVRW